MVFIGGWPAQRLLELSNVSSLCPDANGNCTRPDRISHEHRKLMLEAFAKAEDESGAPPKYVPMKNLRNSYVTIMQGLGASDSLVSKFLGYRTKRVGR